MKLVQMSETLQNRYWAKARYRDPDDIVVAAYADPKIEFIQKHVSLYGKSVLDVGCGNGVFTFRLAKLAGRVVGVDLSSHMLARNAQPYRIQSSAVALPFGDRSFDVVFEANLLHHVKDPEAVLRELCRCSARNLVLIEPSRFNPLMLGFSLMIPAERGILRFSRNTMVRMIERMGFEVNAVTVTGMISQNNTPSFLIPLLKRFDREFILGEYIVLCGQAKDGNKQTLL